MKISNYSNNEKWTKFGVYKQEAETKLNLNPALLYGKKRKQKRRLNIPVGTARIAHLHPTPDCARIEPGPGVMGRGSSATSRSCTLGREVEVEVVLTRGGNGRRSIQMCQWDLEKAAPSGF